MDLRRSLPDAWRVFFRERTPRDIQNAAIPILVRGTSALLSSPTASGKTEAVFAPLYQRHVTFARDRLSVVYIAPTKALVNDMYERLLGYFGETAAEAIQRYTGDHHDFKDAYGKFVVLCTPEALDSLQLLHAGRLTRVRAIICDELHLLHGTPRGQQLRAVMARIRSNAEIPSDPRDAFQIVGMTATVHDQESVAAMWLGESFEIIRDGESRAIEMVVVRHDGTDLASVLADAVRDSEHKKVLVFANTRNDAHLLAAKLSVNLTRERYAVYLHIGILSRLERERVEESMRRESCGICVATSTLEVGVDIGDIDLIVLCTPPPSVGSFLQRIGRGNRRSGRCLVWACASSDNEETVYRALLRCGENGALDEIHEYVRPSVDFQQVISLAWNGVRQNQPLTFQNLRSRSGDAVDVDVVHDMLATGALQNIRGALLPSDRWMDEGDRRRIHSVIAGGSTVQVVDSRTGETIASMGRADHLEGHIYTGSTLTSIHGQDEAGIYLGRGQRHGVLAKLPSTGGRRKGYSRQLTWALARLSGEDPSVWTQHGLHLTTWGGWHFNQLLAVLLQHNGLGDASADSLGIHVFSFDAEVSPALALDLAQKARDSDALPVRLIRSFRDPTPFFSYLSSEMQTLEIRRAVPWDGFIQWLSECKAQ